MPNSNQQVEKTKKKVKDDNFGHFEPGPPTYDNIWKTVKAQDYAKYITSVPHTMKN